MSGLPAWLVVAGALLYLVIPWDLDFIPIAGRLDDLLVLFLALNYAWKRFNAASAPSAGSSEGGREEDEDQDDEDEKGPYSVLGVERDASEAEIRKAYRELLARYHPDRVQHLGEEFREMAARRTVELNRAHAEIVEMMSGRRA